MHMHPRRVLISRTCVMSRQIGYVSPIRSRVSNRKLERGFHLVVAAVAHLFSLVASANQS